MLVLLEFTLSCARLRSSLARWERQAFVFDAAQLLAGSAPDGKVQLSPLGQYLRRADPAVSPKTFERVYLLSMIKA